MLRFIIKRFLLIIIGVVLSLILLECGLRLAGWTISSYQQYKNNKALKNKSQYTVMCLGESTTANNYPVQLQKILDNKYPNKFSIIDCGIAATNLETILNLLNNNITEYMPDITICMMGINDGFTMLNQKKKSDNISYINKSKSTKLKVFKLFFLLKKHLRIFLKDKLLFADNINDYNWIQKYQYLRANKSYENAEKVLKAEIQKNPNNEHAIAELAYFYCFFLTTEDKRDIGMDMAKKVIENKTNNILAKAICYNIILNYCMEFNKDFKFYLNKIVNEDIDVFTSCYAFENYILIKSNLFAEQKDKVLNIINNNNINDTSYGFTAINEIEQKNYQKAEEYFNKAEEIRLNFPNKKTYNLYKLIVKKLIDSNIKVICMQYPVLSIVSLQEQLKNEPYYEELTFISNEKTFKDALMKENYNVLFVDQFAGDFGHCTDLGNKMIAENIINTLENILDLKQN